MDRPLTRRIFPALAALLLALAAGFAHFAAAEDKRNIAGMSEDRLARFSGWLVGAAKSCRSYSSRFLGDARPEKIRDHYAKNPVFQKRLAQSRRHYAGVDLITGDSRKYCDQADEYLNAVIARLKEPSAKAVFVAADKPPKISGTILYHTRMLKNGGGPEGFFSQLTMGAMPKTMFIRNTYRDLVPNASYVRNILFYASDGKIKRKITDVFAPESPTWHVWRKTNPSGIFREPGDWTIVTRISSGEFSAETSRILPVAEGADKTRAGQMNAFNAVIQAE